MVDSVQGKPRVTGAIAPQAARPASSAPPDPGLGADAVTVGKTGDLPKGRVLEGKAYFETGSAGLTAGAHPEFDKTLDAVIATLKTMPADKRAALLADPDFRIEVEGRASNLGSDKKYDNFGLSKRRADNTAAYIRGYFKQSGIDLPPKAIKTSGSGAPGRAKPADDNDPADRSSQVRFNLPGLSPLPPEPTALPGPRPRPEPKPEPTPDPEPEFQPELEPIIDPEPPATPSAAEEALDGFNKATQPLDGMLNKAAAADITLADREATIKKVRAALQAAEEALPRLSPAAQPGAQALLNGLKDKTGRLADRATQERAAFDQLSGQLKTETEEIGKTDKRKLRETSLKLLEKYKADVAKDLPSDAKGAIGSQIATLKHAIYEAIARHSDDSKVDQPDNSYLLGRPGPRFKKAWNALNEILAVSGPITPEHRAKAVNALKDMDDAVKDFDDPLAKEATRTLYDELTRSVSAKLAGG